MMTVDELRNNLSYLAGKYVTDDAKKACVFSLISGIGVTTNAILTTKAILAKLDPYLSGNMSQADAKLVRDIAYNFC